MFNSDICSDGKECRVNNSRLLIFDIGMSETKCIMQDEHRNSAVNIQTRPM